LRGFYEDVVMAYLAPGVVVDETPGVPTPCALGGVIEPWMLVEPLLAPVDDPDMPEPDVAEPVVPVLVDPALAPLVPADEPPAPPLVWAKAIEDVTARTDAKAIVANFMLVSSLLSREKPLLASFVPDAASRLSARGP
jgi:hypothetical protein